MKTSHEAEGVVAAPVKVQEQRPHRCCRVCCCWFVSGRFLYRTNRNGFVRSELVQPFTPVVYVGAVVFTRNRTLKCECQSELSGKSNTLSENGPSGTAIQSVRDTERLTKRRTSDYIHWEGNKGRNCGAKKKKKKKKKADANRIMARKQCSCRVVASQA